MADAESMFALKGLMGALGSAHLDCRQDGMKVAGRHRGGYLFNTSIAAIEAADALLIVGANPRWEAALVNARIRKRWLTGEMKIGLIGEAHDLTYTYSHIGGGGGGVAGDRRRQPRPLPGPLQAAAKPMLILGAGMLARADGAAILHRARAIAEASGMISEDWNGFNILHTAASRVGGIDLDFLPGQGGRDVAGILAGAEAGEIDAVWLLGADEIDSDRLDNAFVIYQGHHGDAGAHCADVILPGAAYTEKDATYVNLEGRAQRAHRAAFPPGEAREDWSIIRALSEVLGQTLPYDDLAQLREQMIAAVPVLGELDRVAPGEWGSFGVEGDIADDDFRSAVTDFYQTNAICRASEVMAECSRLYVNGGAG